MVNAKKVFGKVLLQCNADKTHQWQETYSTNADNNGNPMIYQLNVSLKKRKVQCPKCKCISFKIIRIIVSLVHT